MKYKDGDTFDCTVVINDASDQGEIEIAIKEFEDAGELDSIYISANDLDNVFNPVNVRARLENAFKSAEKNYENLKQQLERLDAK